MEPPLSGMEPHHDRLPHYSKRTFLRWRTRILLAIGVIALVVVIVQGGSWLADKRYCDDPPIPDAPASAREAALALHHSRCE